MKPNKKSKTKAEGRSSSSSSSSSESDNSTSSSNDSRSKSHEANLKKKKASTTSSKDYKRDHSVTRNTEENISKKSDQDDYRRYKKSRNDDKNNHQYHSREVQDYNKKDKYKRDVEPTSSKHNEEYTNRKKETDERNRSDTEKYKKYRDNKEPSRYDHYDRSRNYYKSGNARERTRDGEDRKFMSKDGNRSRNQYNDNRRDTKYSRNKRERSRSRSFDHANAEWGRSEQNSVKKEKGKPVDKQKPNFGLSGKLTEETNTYRGVVIKYSEPPEARKPKRRWRLYPFKGEKALQTLYIHRESAYLIGRDRKVVDLPVDHPSCSKQHAVLQYRLVAFTRDDGSAGKRVRPYIIDLESANGTFINNKKIDPKKYVELLEKDVIKFGFSSREYVLLHENSKDEAQDDDVKQEEEITVKEEPER